MTLWSGARKGHLEAEWNCTTAISAAGPGIEDSRQVGGVIRPELGDLHQQGNASGLGFLHHLLDIELMQQGAELLGGTHDFAAFQTSGSPRDDTVRTLSELSVERLQDDIFERIVIRVSADGFLYNMVRNMVGSLVEVGRSACTLDWLSKALQSKDRRRAGPTAPAHGLTLMQVGYSRDLPADSPAPDPSD